MASRETENNAYAKFLGTNKEHYGMLWYFLEWSIGSADRGRATGHQVCIGGLCFFHPYWSFVEKVSYKKL